MAALHHAANHRVSCSALRILSVVHGTTLTDSLIVSIIAMQLPKLLELVGLGYSAWFVYRYLLFKVSPPERTIT